MQNNQVLLLKNLLRASSSFNFLKYSKDAKAKSKVRMTMFGMSLLYILLMIYCIFTVVGYGMLGITSQIPALCTVTVSIIAGFFTLLKTNGYLFAFKEYDMLMSLPFPTKSVVGAKFLYMYVKSLPWVFSISGAMLIGYGIFAKPAFYVYPLWLLLTLLLPIPATVLAAAVGALFAAIGSRFRHKQLIQAFLSFVFVFIIFALRFILEDVFRSDEVDDMILLIADTMDKIKAVYPPAAWFEGTIVMGRPIDLLLTIVLPILIFEAFILLVGRYYRQINSRLMAGTAGKKYQMTGQRSKSVCQSIAFKEFKAFTGSMIYLVNAGLGEVFVLITSIAIFFVDVDKIIGFITNGSPLTKENVAPAIPILLYFFLGMVATTAFSYSLEGKNLWIIKSLPIKMTDVMKGKMLFNLYLTLPFGLLGCICYGIGFRQNILGILLSCLCIVVLCSFSTTLGMFVNLLLPKFEWENEVEVIKQGASVAVYMLPNLFLAMVLMVLVVALGFFMNPYIVSLVITLVAAAFAGLFYYLVISKVSHL